MPERFKISIDYLGGELPLEEREEWWDQRYLYVFASRLTIKDGKSYYESISVPFAVDSTPKKIVHHLRVIALQQREKDPIDALRYKQVADQIAQNDLGEDVYIGLPPAEQS